MLRKCNRKFYALITIKANRLSWFCYRCEDFPSLCMYVLIIRYVSICKRRKDSRNNRFKFEILDSSCVTVIYLKIVEDRKDDRKLCHGVS